MVAWFCGWQFAPYKHAFQPFGEFGSLEKTELRYKWHEKMLERYPANPNPKPTPHPHPHPHPSLHPHPNQVLIEPQAALPPLVARRPRALARLLRDQLQGDP